jgi:hypothetical protein
VLVILFFHTLMDRKPPNFYLERWRRTVCEIHLSHYPPPAFQVRFGGSKEVLLLSRPWFICLSFSSYMNKLDSTSTMLHQPCYMNRGKDHETNQDQHQQTFLYNQAGPSLYFLGSMGEVYKKALKTNTYVCISRYIYTCVRAICVLYYQGAKGHNI